MHHTHSYIKGIVEALKSGKKANFETIEPTENAKMPVKIKDFEAVDISGSDMATDIWKHYFPTADCLFYVLDGTQNEEALKKGVKVLMDQLKEESLAKKPIAILVNKQDAESYKSSEELAPMLNMNVEYKLGESKEIEFNRDMKFFDVSAHNFYGFLEAFKWVKPKACTVSRERKLIEATE